MKKALIALALIAIASLLYWVGPKPAPLAASENDVAIPVRPPAELVSPSPNKPSSPRSELPSNVRMAVAFATPITFYGRVIDQHGTPVANATVAGSATATLGSTTKVATKTDDAGNFTLQSKGIRLFVSVNRPGFIHLFPGQKSGMFSERGFSYVAGVGDGIHEPDPSRPIVFYLYKPGPSEALVHLKAKPRQLKRTGEPIEVALDQDHGANHKIWLSCKSAESKTADGRFSWRFEVRAVSGKIQQRAGNLDFEAPSVGYALSDIVDMDQAIARPQWVDSTRRSYFVHFDDDTYARVDVEMIAFGDYFVEVEGYYNPKTGSRNLEAHSSP
ncbi:carboxypeptidase-like regulatory domain-containing protein [Brevifollis gellanilyticus]|uniref:Carboxypeptidase regulatory-like domain-containing protein n=1 Tax=Brevifollis gellanilyticus TaxID=748831 RepID=A0A512M8V9_9BACT|nr:carboxypeptidase-like regulatory domain-containing protein [Brevifollis gellanilyticus]GEP43178.1 hypothetical protein BGE01nite_24690 [Brevifollis gellanilyticus]